MLLLIIDSGSSGEIGTLEGSARIAALYSDDGKGAR